MDYGEITSKKGVPILGLFWTPILDPQNDPFWTSQIHAFRVSQILQISIHPEHESTR